VRILFLFFAFFLAQARSDYFICFGGSKNVLFSQRPPQRFFLKTIELISFFEAVESDTESRRSRNDSTEETKGKEVTESYFAGYAGT
jgi:hypothetical protein